MNYQNVYIKLVENAKNKRRTKNSDVYYENHHIIPKCLGGNDVKENLVLLTLREHYVAHKLLTRIYPNHSGIALAFHSMTFSKNFNHVISSRDFQYAKEITTKTPQKSHYNIWLEKYGKDEAEKRLNERSKKFKNTVTGRKYSKERIKKAADGHRGIKMSKESSLKKSQSMQGKNQGPRSQEVKDKIRLGMLGNQNAKK